MAELAVKRAGDLTPGDLIWNGPRPIDRGVCVRPEGQTWEEYIAECLASGRYVGLPIVKVEHETIAAKWRLDKVAREAVFVTFKSRTRLWVGGPDTDVHVLIEGGIMTELVCALCDEPILDDDDSTGDETGSYHYRCWDESFPGLVEDTDKTEKP